MQTLGTVSIGDVLAEWGAHEAEGRLIEGGTLPRGFLGQFSAQGRRLQAIGVALQVRRSVVAAIFAARPTESVRVEVQERDLPAILVMGAKPLADYSRDKLAERSPSADYVRSLAGSAKDITGPVVAVARKPEGQYPVRRRAQDGRLDSALQRWTGLPVIVHVVVTTDVCPRHQLQG